MIKYSDANYQCDATNPTSIYYATSTITIATATEPGPSGGAGGEGGEPSQPPDPLTPPTTSFTTKTVLMYKVPAFQIRWRSSDLACMETAPIPSTTSTSTGLPSSTLSVDRPPPLSSPDGGGGFSPGETAGVAIGVFALVLGLAWLIYYVLRRKGAIPWGGTSSKPAPPGQRGDACDTAGMELHGGQEVRFGHV